MAYLIGVILAAATAGFAVLIGFDRERAFYPTVAIVVATYYILFAAMGAGGRTLAAESVAAAVFLLVAALGYRKSAWIVAAALVGHGVFDFFHHSFDRRPRSSALVAGLLHGLRRHPRRLGDGAPRA